MPIRKSELSDPPLDSRRASLRRLSSIASFHVLNPFTKRRSNNNTDSTATSSTSNLSLTSTIANAPQPQSLQPSSSQTFPSEDELTALPIPPVPSHLASKRSSYICLPDDPIGGMPRSRTFSNLPLPTRARRNTAMVPSKSHSRLPSAFLPSSRVPSPAVTHGKHSMSKLAASEPKPPIIRNRMRRSDTEPLLPVNLEQMNSIGRSTAFKENITLSPVKPLPRGYHNRKPYGSALPSSSYADRHGWVDRSDGSEALLPSDASATTFSSSLPLSHHAQKLSYSSPAYRRSRDRVPTPGYAQPVQRWNSQPVLTNVTNRRNSRHGEITERRLLSGLQPDAPPPPPKTPLIAEALMLGRVKSLNNSGHLQEFSEQSPSVTKLASKPRAPSPVRTGIQITKREPAAYWCGCFSALNDRYRNEELSAHLGSTKANSDRMHSAEANTRRMRRALEHMHSLCATQEARESFVVFQLQFAALQNMPDLGRPILLSLPERKIVLNRVDSVGSEMGGAGAGAGASEGRKATFMDRLLGRHRRSLQVV